MGEVVGKLVRVRVSPLPAWIDVARLLGPEFERIAGGPQGDFAQAELGPEAAADVGARLRGLGLDGVPLTLQVEPPLARSLVREARLREARARRQTTPAFSRSGARARGAGRYSLTPEALALALAHEARGLAVVDACCGSGGNALAFARAGCAVVAVDIDPERIADARHNAQVYGVAGRVRFVEGDALRELSQLSADILFLDPPWGLGYDKRATSLADFPLLVALLALPRAVRARYGALWLKLPASFATRSLPPSRVRAVFGEGGGDFRRIKFILAQLALPGDDP